MPTGIVKRFKKARFKRMGRRPQARTNGSSIYPHLIARNPLARCLFVPTRVIGFKHSTECIDPVCLWIRCRNITQRINSVRTTRCEASPSASTSAGTAAPACESISPRAKAALTRVHSLGAQSSWTSDSTAGFPTAAKACAASSIWVAPSFHAGGASCPSACSPAASSRCDKRAHCEVTNSSQRIGSFDSKRLMIRAQKIN